jgi:hypothetical protein
MAKTDNKFPGTYRIRVSGEYKEDGELYVEYYNKRVIDFRELQGYLKKLIDGWTEEGHVDISTSYVKIEDEDFWGWF